MSDDDDIDFSAITRKKKKTNRKGESDIQISSDETGTSITLNSFESIVSKPSDNEAILEGVSLDDVLTKSSNNILETLYGENTTPNSTTIATTTTSTTSSAATRQNIMELRLQQAKNIAIQKELEAKGITTTPDLVFDSLLSSESSTTGVGRGLAPGSILAAQFADPAKQEEGIKQQYFQRRAINTDIMTQLATDYNKTAPKLFINDRNVSVDDDDDPKKLKGGISEVNLGLEERTRVSRTTEALVAQQRERNRDYGAPNDSAGSRSGSHLSGPKRDEQMFKERLKHMRK
jgi:hypothetical protein